MDELATGTPQLTRQTKRCFLQYRLWAVAAFLAAVLAAALGSGAHPA